ncbi:DUF4142 domain-containing protein [Mesorhizobium sp. 1M-11]|uniref:DUF4142 domain-containing protein n=1 Tax=Mesorhizobium sp. 1M-11 TaxID=1529006 RepID=UPI0006C76877|nr:DUF4142 domain-containing protein [Mesorhizobium sp. 1M-11]
MKKLVLAAAIVLAATAALAQSAAEKAGVNSLLGVSPSTEDFVKKAATGDLFEIAVSKLAIERADPATKSFAEEMVRDHERIGSELKQMVENQAINAVVPAEMTESQKETIAELQEMRGQDFNDRYHSEQVKAHADAVDLFQRYSEKGEHTAIKTWAANTLPVLRHHLDMAKELNE